MKKAKTILCSTLIAATVLLSSTPLTVSANSAKCPNCPAPMYDNVTTGSWYFVKNTTCAHDRPITDKIYNRKITTKWSCSNCGFNTSSSTTETKSECYWQSSK